MLKRTLILLILALAQTGCSIEEGEGAYEPIPMTEEGRRLHERDKRESLSIEDITLGDGPLAAWSRKIRADIEVRYTERTVAYRGPMLHTSVFMEMFSFTPLPRRLARSPSAKPVSGRESTAWRLAVSDASLSSPAS